MAIVKNMLIYVGKIKNIVINGNLESIDFECAENYNLFT